MRFQNKCLVLIIQFCSFCSISHAANLDLFIDTSKIQGTSAEIEIDFNAGDGILLNTVTINNLQTDGTVVSGNAQLTGAVSGELISNIVMQNLSYFNEIIEPITLGSYIDFKINATDNLDITATIQDSISIMLLDTKYNSIINTTDPSGFNSLMLYQINGSSIGDLQVYSNYNNNVTWQSSVITSIPITSSIWLFSSFILPFLFKKSNKKYCK